jgi:hypothetical protein
VRMVIAKTTQGSSTIGWRSTAGIFCSSSRRTGGTDRHRARPLITEWEDGAVEVCYRNEGIEYEDLVLRPSAVTAPKARPHREPAQHRRSKPAPNHPGREGHEGRRKQLLLDRTQMSALIRASASASP